MPKPTIKVLQADLDRTRQRVDAQFKELEHLKTRIKDISGENETLLQDKKWLQQMHSAVLQSMHEFVKGVRH